MGLEENPIFGVRPAWVDLEELERAGDRVWFRTKRGRMSVAQKDVDEWKRRQAK